MENEQRLSAHFRCDPELREDVDYLGDLIKEKCPGDFNRLVRCVESVHVAGEWPDELSDRKPAAWGHWVGCGPRVTISVHRLPPTEAAENMHLRRGWLAHEFAHVCLGHYDNPDLPLSRDQLASVEAQATEHIGSAWQLLVEQYALHQAADAGREGDLE